MNAKRLRAQSNVPMVLTPHSGGAFAIQAFNEQDTILGAYTSVPTIVEKGNKLIFRIPPSFPGYIEPFINVQMKTFGKKLGMAPADHDYAKAWSGFSPAEEGRRRGRRREPDVLQQGHGLLLRVSRVVAAKPDVMFIGGASEPPLSS